MKLVLILLIAIEAITAGFITKCNLTQRNYLVIVSSTYRGFL